MAKMDRRMGIERRQRDEIYYVDGIPKERRSGDDRRGQSGDRRNGNEPVVGERIDLEPSQPEPQSTDKAARIQADSIH